MKRLKTGLLIMSILALADASLYLTVRLATADGIIDAVERVEEMAASQPEQILMSEMIIGPATILERM